MHSFITTAVCLTTSILAAQEISPIIVDGRRASGENGYVAQMRGSTTTMAHCGGSLIAPNFVLTAAHCQMAEPISHVVLAEEFNGLVNRNKMHKVKTVTIHPDYDPVAVKNDFAVVELERSVDNVTPVYLAPIDKSMEQPEQLVTLFGWGITDRASTVEVQMRQDAASLLQQDDYEIIETSKCARKMKAAVKKVQHIPEDKEDYDGLTMKQKLNLYLMKKMNSDEPSAVCIDSDHGEGPCYGDSGGPLVVNKNDNRPIQVGVASWLSGICGVKDMPTVFARVSSASDFINKVSYGHHWYGDAKPVARDHKNSDKKSSAAHTTYSITIVFLLPAVMLIN